MIFHSLLALSIYNEACVVDFLDRRGDRGSWDSRFVQHLNDWELGAMDRFLFILQGESVKREQRIE